MGFVLRNFTVIMRSKLFSLEAMDDSGLSNESTMQRWSLLLKGRDLNSTLSEECIPNIVQFANTEFAAAFALV